MPFRAGNGTKELFMFQSYAKQKEKNHHKKKRGSILVDDHHNECPVWIPGFVLFPLPGQPEWMMDLDAAFWSNLLYVVGSVVYVAQGLYFWHDVAWKGNPPMTEYDDYSANNPSNYLNLIGAALFVANALVALVDWWLCAQQASVMNVSLDHVGDEQTEGKFLVQDMGQRILNLYFWNNIFFMLAAITWLIGGIWLYDKDTDTYKCFGEGNHSQDWEDEQGTVHTGTKCGNFWIPFVATGNYLLSSLCGLWEYFETTRFRKQQNLPPLPMFTLDFYKLDWFGWGDWLYFIASALPFCQSFMTGFIEWDTTGDMETRIRKGKEEENGTLAQQNRTVAPVYNVSNFIFLIDSLAYFIGYVLFVREIIAVMQKRHIEEEQERLRHGNLDHLMSSRESFAARDNDDHYAETSQYVKNAVVKMTLRRDSTIVPARRPSGGSMRRGSGHGAAIMNMGRRSFSEQEQLQQVQLSPLASPRASFNGGSYPGYPSQSPSPGRLSTGRRLSSGGVLPGFGQEPPVPPMLSILGLGAAVPPVAMSQVPRASPSAYL